MGQGRPRGLEFKGWMKRRGCGGEEHGDKKEECEERQSGGKERWGLREESGGSGSLGGEN